MVVVELLDAFCQPCSGAEPDWGSNTTGAGGSSGSSQNGPSQNPGMDPCSEPPPVADPDGADIATDVGLGLGVDTALSAAGGTSAGTGGGAGVLGVLWAMVQGSQTLAEGLTVVIRNGGRGYGGSGCGGRRSMEEAMKHIGGQGADGTRYK